MSNDLPALEQALKTNPEGTDKLGGNETTEQSNGYEETLQSFHVDNPQAED